MNAVLVEHRFVGAHVGRFGQRLTDLQFQVADAQALPFADGRFDVVLSTFGVMFTPDHARAAGGMLRVLRRGGRIALANWTPEGFIGRLFKVVGAHVPPPPGVLPPALWGTESHVVELFGAQAAQFRCQRRLFRIRYRSAVHWLQVFRDLYGPVHNAFFKTNAIAAALLLAAAAGTARADDVTDWNAKANAIVAEAKLGTPPAIRVLAIVQTAAHEAIAALPPGHARDPAVGAATLAVAHRVTLGKLLPAQQVAIEAATQARAGRHRRRPGQEGRTRGGNPGRTGRARGPHRRRARG